MTPPELAARTAGAPTAPLVRETPLDAAPHPADNLGRFGAGWIAAASLLLCGLGFGVYSYAQQLLYGEVVTGMRTIGMGGATWGLYIVCVVFFIGVSFAGITVAAIIRLFNIETIRPLSRLAELVTITALIMGALAILADLGQPLKGLINLPKYARPMSPFFGTFSLVMGGYLSASLLYFFLAGRADAAACAARGGRMKWFHKLWACGYSGTPAEQARHHRVSFWLALVILPMLVTAHTTLGFIFGIQGGRPGWFNALSGPGFVVMAGVSGIGVVIVVAAAIRKFLHLEDEIRPPAFRWLGNLLFVLTGAYLYFMIAEEVTANYAASTAETKIAHEIVFGAYAPLFWTVVACLAIPFVMLFTQFVRGKAWIGWTVTAGLMVNVAAILKRFLIVVPSQTHGSLLPWETGSYSPSWVEYGVVGGLLCLGTLLFMVFVKIFPIVPVESHAHVDVAAASAEPVGRKTLRLAAFVGSLVVGVGLAVTGFLISARFGTEPTMDPILPFSPVLFITGVVTCLFSAVVYEILPPARSGAEESLA